jgi:hypothetical protein
MLTKEIRGYEEGKAGSIQKDSTLPETTNLEDMSQKRIALIGYSPADYFYTFCLALESSGFEVFWVHSCQSASNNHKSKLCTPPARILDTTENFRTDFLNKEICRKELLELESAGGPRINDIILMDRILKNKSYTFALCYLSHLQEVLTKFFISNRIALVSSGRDTALSLISMLVCRKLKIPWIVPTRVRIPRDMYMFTSGHETASVLDIRPPTREDRVWAEDFLKNYRSTRSEPVLKVATRTFSDVIKLVPTHSKVFWGLVKASFIDHHNDYSRYTITLIIWMYLKRRFNLFAFKLFPPYSSVGQKLFCLYALHTQPESSIDVASSFFSDQTALITVISRSLPVTHELYVKIHPTDVDGHSLLFYKRIARLPGVRLINYNVDSRDLVQRATIIFTLTGTIGYEAALMGKNVVTFANNYYNQMPTVHYCDAPPKLQALIGSLLNSKPRENINDSTISFLANLKAKSFRGEFNRMYLAAQDQLTTQDLKTLQDAYNAVYACVVSPKKQLSEFINSAD